MVFKKLIDCMGPGVLLACLAIGGSHLVWSTRAGAFYGFELVGLILLANFLKFPFFFYGQRYTAATGKSLLEGYAEMGKIYVRIYWLIIILTAGIILAGISMIGGAILSGIGISFIKVTHLSILILLFCFLLVVAGKYMLLDRFSKWIIGILTVATVTALVLALAKGSVAPEGFEGPSPWTVASFPFLIMLMGWMPAPVELSAWSSLWMFSKKDVTGKLQTCKEANMDFTVGYVITALLAIVFLSLGALVMYGSGETFSQSGIGFSHQLISLYSKTIGEWAKWIILLAAFLTIFSTIFAGVDGYRKAMAASFKLSFPQVKLSYEKLQNIWISIMVLIAVLILLFFVNNMISLIGFAAIVSFVVSPIFAIINLKVMLSPEVPKEHKPGPFLMTVSISGILFLSLMTAGFLAIKLGWIS